MIIETRSYKMLKVLKNKFPGYAFATAGGISFDVNSLVADIVKEKCPREKYLILSPKEETIVRDGWRTL